MAVAARKRPESHLDKVDQIIDWKPIEGFLKKKLRRRNGRLVDPAYPALGMFKVLLPQRWHVLSCQGM